MVGESELGAMKAYGRYFWAVVVVVCMILSCSVGIWFGTSMNPEIRFQLSNHYITCGGGDFPKEAFETVNQEIPKKIEVLLGNNEDQNHLVILSPSTAGYLLNMAGSTKSRLWDKQIQEQLDRWIFTRMNDVTHELHKEAEQADAIPSLTQPHD